MAEMTAEKVKALLESFAALCGSNAKAKELCGDAIKFVEQQAAEIAKKDRMLCRATVELDNAHYCAIGGGMPDNMQHCDNSGGNYSCADCWLAWLEKEAQGVE